MTFYDMVVSTRQHHQEGRNMIRQLEGFSTTVSRRIVDDVARFPFVDVHVRLSAMLATISDLEYEIITTVAGRNFSEPSKAPIPVTWMVPEEEEDLGGGGSRGRDVLPEEGQYTYDTYDTGHGAGDGGEAEHEDEEAPKKRANRTFLRFVLHIQEASMKLLNLVQVRRGRSGTGACRSW